MPGVHMLLLFVYISYIKADIALELFIRFCSLRKHIVKYFVIMVGHPWILPFFMDFHNVKLVVKVHNLREQMVVFWNFFLKCFGECLVKFTCSNIYLGRHFCFNYLASSNSIFIFNRDVENWLTNFCLDLLVFEVTRINFD